MDPHQPLMDAGLDSLGAVELRSALSQACGAELPVSLTFDYPTVAALSQYLAGITGQQSDAEVSRRSFEFPTPDMTVHFR